MIIFSSGTWLSDQETKNIKSSNQHMKKYGIKTSNSSSSPETWKNGLHYSHRNCKVLYQTLHPQQRNPEKGKIQTISTTLKKMKNIKNIMKMKRRQR